MENLNPTIEDLNRNEAKEKQIGYPLLDANKYTHIYVPIIMKVV